MNTKKLFKAVQSRFYSSRRRILETVGISYYSKPAFNEIDTKLEKHLPNQGIFIEAGAFDGFTESNTYYLEKIKKWRGVLIEPSIGNFKSCIKIRSCSKVYNCGLVSDTYSDKTIKICYGGLMSFAVDAFANKTSKQERMEVIKKYNQPFEFEVEARTLNSILDECNFPQIDFFSLDVEGYEVEVLKGLDFSRHKPRFILVECRTRTDREAIETHLSNHYVFLEQLSHRDYLYKAVG